MGVFLSKPITEKEVFEGEGMSVRWGGAAMQGWRSKMEDAHIATALHEVDPSMFVFAVFDGHGGEEVAKFCEKYFISELTKLKLFKEGDVEQALIESFLIIDEKLGDPEYFKDFDVDGDDMISPFAENTGSCALLSVKKGNELYVANAGDCRGVLSRCGEAVALSQDHKPFLEAERARILAAGGRVEDKRVNGNLAVSRAIGDLKFKTNTRLSATQQAVTALPEVKKVVLTPQDSFFVLACDGVWDVMTNQQVVDFVQKHLEQGMSPSKVACTLLDHCLSPDSSLNEGIGCDNMTAMVIQLTDKS